MKIRFEDATAAQLRQYLLEVHGIERPALSNTASLLKTIREVGDTAEDFELKGEEPSPEPVDPHNPTDEELEREAGTFSAEKLVEALMSQGMPEDEARDVAGLTVNAQIQKQIRDSDELPYGEGKEHLYVTVRIRPGQGKFGNEPIPVSVNGETIYIPRGVDFPIRTPYLECLMHAERIEYEEIVRPDEYGVPHVEHRPRKSLSYPVELLTPVPYDRAQAEKVAQQANAQIAELQTAGRAIGSSPASGTLH